MIDTKRFVDAELMLVRKLFDTRKEVVPMFVLVRGARHDMVPVMFADDNEKDAVADAVREIVKTIEPDIVLFMCEAWTYQAKEYDPQTSIRPSLHKDRVEVVTVTVEFKTGEKYMCMANIKRSKDKVSLGEFSVTDGQQNVGRFADFYPPKALH